jgi:hypothetical protein
MVQENKGKVKNYRPKHKIIDLPVWDYNVRIQGDVKFVFYDHDNFSAPDKVISIFKVHLVLCPAFLRFNDLLQLSASDVSFLDTHGVYR